MIPVDFLFAFPIALLTAGLMSALFGGCGRRRGGRWPAFLLMFILLLPLTWAGGVWLSPFGPELWGAHWLPFVVTAVISALLLATITAPWVISSTVIRRKATEFGERDITADESFQNISKGEPNKASDQIGPGLLSSRQLETSSNTQQKEEMIR